MSIEGNQLARTMLSIHEVDFEQASRYPGRDLSDRIERSVRRQRRNCVRCRLGGVLVSMGRRLQQRHRPYLRPLEKAPTATSG